MGITIGWIALLLGATGAQPADKNAAQIAYTVKMVEAEGLNWRSCLMPQLKPVTRQGSATVWTMPRSAANTLVKTLSKHPAGAVVQGPRVIAQSGVPATIQVRQNRQFVTQVSWNGEEASPTGTPENLRVGWHTTLVGRKLDQGILVKMVLEDTEVRAVHEMPIDALSEAKSARSTTSGTTHGESKAIVAAVCSFEDSPFETPVCPSVTKETTSPGKENCESGSNLNAAKKQEMKDLMVKAQTAYQSGKYDECEALAKRALSVDPEDLQATILFYKARMERRFKADKKKIESAQSQHEAATMVIDEVDLDAIIGPEVQIRRAHYSKKFKELTIERMRRDNRLLQLPEIASQEVLGEWLIPNGECLLVSFGPHTEADKDGKAVVRERLAIIEADAKSVAVTAQRALPAPHYIVNPVPQIVIAPPETPPAMATPDAPEAAPVHAFPPPVVSAPASVSPLPSGRYMHDDVKYFPSGPDFPWANEQAAKQRARMKAMGVEPPPRVATAPFDAPADSAPAAPTNVTRMPAPPSRSIPQGIHADGSKAKLPPLPEDEMDDDDDSDDSESAEPRPSPQTKKPHRPTAKAKVETKPATDEGATKASFVRPRPSTVFLPSVFLPGSTVGFQFLVPITPLSIRLPFNQRLVIEIYGRVIPETRAAEIVK